MAALGVTGQQLDDIVSKLRYRNQCPCWFASFATLFFVTVVVFAGTNCALFRTVAFPCSRSIFSAQNHRFSFVRFGLVGREESFLEHTKLSMRQQVMLFFYHFRVNPPIRVISRQFKIHRSTVTRYIVQARAALRSDFVPLHFGFLESIMFYVTTECPARSQRNWFWASSRRG